MPLNIVQPTDPYPLDLGDPSYEHCSVVTVEPFVKGPEECAPLAEVPAQDREVVVIAQLITPLSQKQQTHEYGTGDADSG